MIVRYLSPLCLLALLIAPAFADEPDSALQPEPEAFPAAVEPLPLPIPPPDNGHVRKRLFGILPNYRAIDTQTTYSHPSVKEKFKIARQNSFDWPNYFINAGFAIQNQVAQNGFEGSGFGKTFAEYYARAWADGIIGNYTTQAILPSLLGEDPRYIRMGEGSGWARTWHAMSQVAITKGTNGKKRVNMSELGGNVIVVGVTQLYYPDTHQGLSSAATRWGLSVGNDAFANLLNEFLPDLERKFHRKH